MGRINLFLFGAGGKGGNQVHPVLLLVEPYFGEKLTQRIPVNTKTVDGAAQCKLTVAPDVGYLLLEWEGGEFGHGFHKLGFALYTIPSPSVS